MWHRVQLRGDRSGHITRLATTELRRNLRVMLGISHGATPPCGRSARRGRVPEVGTVPAAGRAAGFGGVALEQAAVGLRASVASCERLPTHPDLRVAPGRARRHSLGRSPRTGRRPIHERRMALGPRLVPVGRSDPREGEFVRGTLATDRCTKLATAVDSHPIRRTDLDGWIRHFHRARCRRVGVVRRATGLSRFGALELSHRRSG